MPDIRAFYDASFYIVALAISGSALIFNILEGRTKKRQNRIFNMLVVDLIVSVLASNLISFCGVNGTGTDFARLLFDIGQYVYFVSHNLLAPFFYVYILASSDLDFVRRNSRRHALIMTPCIIAEVLVLINPATHWVYVTDADFVFTRGWGESVLYIAAAFYFGMAGLYLFVYWSRLAFAKRWAMLYSYCLALVGVLLQLVIQGLHVELMFESIAIMGMLLHLEREDDRIDAATKLYNRNALRLDMTDLIKMGRSFRVICVHITNSDVTTRLIGTELRDGLMYRVGEYLCTVHRRERVYLASPSCFMLLAPDVDDEKAGALSETIAERFDEPWVTQGSGTKIEMKLNAVTMRTSVPDEAESAEDVFLLADCDISEIESSRVLSGGELRFIRKNVEIETALRRALREHHFELYYQPVYEARTRAMYSVNAMLYLNDPAVGLLAPSDYEHIAKRSGLQEALEDYLIEEACVFLNSGIPTGMGINVIDTDVSAVWCVHPEFIEKMRTYVEKYNIEPSRLCLELQDISLIDDYGRLAAALDTLREMGFRLAVDRYGAGESGVQVLSTYDYDVVSVDMSVFSEMENDEIRQSILQNGLRMIRALKKVIHVRGITDREQALAMETVEIDYVQGDFYSGAVSQNELIAILKATENARREEQKALAQSEAKSSFLANMSHEIRTPINAILGMNEMIIRESGEEQIKNYAYDIERACASLLSIINDVLDFSKIEAGSMEIVETEYDLSSLVHDVTNMVRVRTEEKGLALHIDIDEKLPERLYGDEARLRQILINLMNNAAKYTDEGSVTLRMRGYRTMEAFRLVCDIIDTGIGIREEDQQHLFDKFQRFDIEKNRTVEGSGLGLAITYNLLSMMHGNISVNSEYGKGSTFTIVLPQRVVDDAPIGNLEARYRDINDTRRRYEKSFTAPDAHILVVDDTRVNLTVIKGLLKQTQLIIDTATSGAEALSMIEETAYDIILLDYRMPEMDGNEALARMKASETHPNQNTPVIVLTANALSGAREKFLEEGFDDYLSKPVSGEKLEATLLKYLPEDKVVLAKNKESGVVG